MVAVHAIYGDKTFYLALQPCLGSRGEVAIVCAFPFYRRKKRMKYAAKRCCMHAKLGASQMRPAFFNSTLHLYLKRKEKQPDNNNCSCSVKDAKKMENEWKKWREEEENEWMSEWVSAAAKRILISSHDAGCSISSATTFLYQIYSTIYTYWRLRNVHSWNWQRTRTMTSTNCKERLKTMQ